MEIKQLYIYASAHYNSKLQQQTTTANYNITYTTRHNQIMHCLPPLTNMIAQQNAPHNSNSILPRQCHLMLC